MSKTRELIISPKVSQAQLAKFLPQLEEEGIKTVYLDPKKLNSKTKLDTIYPSSAANYIIIEKEGSAKPKGKKIGRKFEVLSNKDIEDILTVAKKGLDFVIVEVKDWKIIPLENIIAKLHKINTKIFAIANTPEEVRKMFSILEVGVDGVIFNTGSINEVREAMVYLGTRRFDLKSAKIIEIKEVGDGERVCVDTASMLHKGEGMLIGSRSNFLFLVHNESVGSSFTSPRPFRVNAGAVHCYTLSPDGTTNYLSEVETGSEVLIINSKGKARRATVGRSKIERRPMLMIKASVGVEIGGIIAQDAETIRFVKPNGELVSVTHLKKGDSVMVHAKSATGRHFGMEVSDEYILEK
ncbi:3-dehydroquinate synthase II [Nitrosarchaeum sp.]|uniref:3-dehydroquinate synthase II n=1 Tax=Nitrosarchaeum sp. TaxID=2026886 RepID=UPI00247E68E2|nr:3-dehydroquinate synthase II [Nitrosarchaeum sp.]MCV0412157.1 3-dehydroquinate synthase II [Nitrosarchaeum sp.]